MTKLIIHIGTQKTGTSVIQTLLSRNRIELAKQGLNYVLWGRGPHGTAAYDAQHLLAHHWARGWLSDKAHPEDVSLAWEQFVESLTRNPDQTRLISSEHFYKGGVTNPEYIENMKRSLDGVDCQVLVYFRRPDEFALSNWAHSVKTIPEFNKSFYDYIESKALKDLLSYKHNLGIWQEIFGVNNVKVKIYDRKKFPNGNVIDDFLGAVGINRTPGMINVEDTNVSLSKFALDLLHGYDRSKIKNFGHLLSIIEKFTSSSLPAERSRELDPLTQSISAQLLVRHIDDFKSVAEFAGAGDVIENLKPKSNTTYVPITDETRSLVLAIWQSRYA